MDVIYTLRGITFEWDSRKAIGNFRKHKVSFETACEVFFDPFICYLDDETIADELRETVVGLTSKWQMLYVVYVLRVQTIRIISARFVTNTEREIYENQ